ncbi:hypothetical protein BC833DRAFT_658932 [Globomyces pollinis-pini]|nr:hypothetical protein BC833DRAFT_658932 [Globomyces pollinis-pini]
MNNSTITTNTSSITTDRPLSFSFSLKLKDSNLVTIEYESPHPFFTNNKHTISRSLDEFLALSTYFTKSYPQHIIPPIINTNNPLLFATYTTQYLEFISNHPILPFTKGFKIFLESEFSFVPPTSPNLIKKSKSFFSLIEPTTKDIDVYFDLAKMDLQSLHHHVAAIGKNNEKIGNTTKELTKCYAEVASKSKDLSTLVDWVPLARLYHLDCDLMGKSSTFRLHTFNDQCVYILQGSMLAQNALDYRLTTLTSYESACRSTQKRLTAMEKLRASKSIPQDKVDSALEEMAVIKRIEEDARDLFKKTSDTLRHEFDAYRIQRNLFLESMLDNYVDEMKTSAIQLESFLRLID